MIVRAHHTKLPYHQRFRDTNVLLLEDIVKGYNISIGDIELSATQNAQQNNVSLEQEIG